MDSFLCRLCRASIASGSDVCLFSQTAVRQNLPGRITDLLDVPIAAKDGLPQHICNKCKRKLERLEKAAEELEDFRTQASSNHTILASTRRELKRTVRLWSKGAQVTSLVSPPIHVLLRSLAFTSLARCVSEWILIALVMVRVHMCQCLPTWCKESSMTTSNGHSEVMLSFNSAINSKTSTLWRHHWLQWDNRCWSCQ